MAQHLPSASNDFYNYLNNAKKKYLYSFNSSKYSTNAFQLDPMALVKKDKDFMNFNKTNEIPEYNENLKDSLLNKSLEIKKSQIKKLNRKAERVFINKGFKIIKK